MKRIAVLISGSGSNLQALIDAIATRTLNARIALVVSNREGVLGLERARKAGIATQTLPLEPWLASGRTRADYDADVAVKVADAEPDLVVLAGWMHVFSRAFLDRFPSKVINLHPALPGKFPGTHAIDRALEAFKRGEISHTGIMVHHVIPEIDAGAALGTVSVPILPDDTIESLSTRMHKAEHRLLVEVVQRSVSP